MGLDLEDLRVRNCTLLLPLYTKLFFLELLLSLPPLLLLGEEITGEKEAWGLVDDVALGISIDFSLPARFDIEQ